MGECILDKILRVIVFFRLEDYLLCLICGLVAFGVSKARPHCRPFSWTDSTIGFPYSGRGTFPSWTLPLIAVLPGVAYVIGEAIRHVWWVPRLQARRGLGEKVEDDGHRQHSQRSRSWKHPQEQRNSIEVVATEEGEEQQLAKQPQASVATVSEPDRTVPCSPAGVASSPILDTAPGLTNRSSASPRPQSLGQRDHSIVPYGLRGAEASNGDNTNRDMSSGSGGSGPQHGVSSPRQRSGEGSTRRGVLLRAPWQRFLAHAHMWVLTQAFAVTFAMLVVNSVKVYAGRLRPDFLSRLRREGFTESSTEVDWCAAGKGGRVSFPSGHSAISFAAFVPFSFYVLHTLHAFSRGGVSLWRIVVGLFPLILPITVAVSRTRDYRHDFDDVVAGSLIGIASALIAVGANLMVNGKTGQLMPRLPA